MMERFTDWLKAAAAALGGVAAYLWGPWDALIIALVVFVILDYITGIAKAAICRELSSKAGFHGLLKKVAIFVLVAIGTVMDSVIPAANHAIRSAVIMFYIANEGLSILENAGQLGLPLPKVLKKALEKMKDADEKPEDVPVEEQE